MIDQAIRRRTHHHQQLIPISHRPASNHHHRAKQTYIDVKVILDYSSDTALALWYQLPKDLQAICKGSGVNQLRKYFVGGLINIPTDDYPHPEITCGLITDVRKTHHYSHLRTRSQFIQYDNLDDLQFLTHDYDDLTKQRITATGNRIVKQLHYERHSKMYAVLDWLIAALAFMLTLLVNTFIQIMELGVLGNACALVAMSLGCYFCWKYAFAGADAAAVRSSDFRQQHLKKRKQKS